MKGGDHWLAVGFAAGLPAVLGAFGISVRRSGAVVGATLVDEVLRGTLDLMLAALILGLAAGFALRRRGLDRRHAIPVAAGLLAGLLALGFAGGGPADMGGDGEGNFHAEPAAYAIMILFAGTVAMAKWWPRDGSSLPTGSLVALTVPCVAWATGHVRGVVDLTIVFPWMTPAALAVAAYTWLWHASRFQLSERNSPIVAWAVPASLVIAGAAVLVFTGWFLFFATFWTWDSAGPMALWAATWVLVPAAPLAIDLWHLGRRHAVAAPPPTSTAP